MKHIKSFNEAMFADESGNIHLPEYLIDDANDDEDDSYEKGKESKENDCDIEENPYEDDSLRDAWDAGFNSKY